MSDRPIQAEDFVRRFSPVPWVRASVYGGDCFHYGREFQGASEAFVGRESERPVVMRGSRYWLEEHKYSTRCGFLEEVVDRYLRLRRATYLDRSRWLRSYELKKIVRWAGRRAHAWQTANAVRAYAYGLVTAWGMVLVNGRGRHVDGRERLALRQLDWHRRRIARLGL